MSVKKEHFGEMPDGREVSLYTITNKNGLEASVTDLGAVWVRMVVPDKNGDEKRTPGRRQRSGRTEAGWSVAGRKRNT